jgi:hypothetical protein
MYIYDPWMF